MEDGIFLLSEQVEYKRNKCFDYLLILSKRDNFMQMVFVYK